MIGSSMVSLPEDEVDRLYDRDRWLRALEAAGVDNWSGMEYAIQLMEEMYPPEDKR